MRTRSILLAPLLALCSAQPALAKDVCFQDGVANFYVFRAVKKLKPGGSVPISGTIRMSGSNALHPLSGTALMTFAGQIEVGIFIHGSASGNWTETMTFDAEWSLGSGDADLNGDFVNDGAGLVLEKLDCKVATAPPG